MIGIVFSLILLIAFILSIYGIDMDNRYYIYAMTIFFQSYFLGFWWIITLLCFIAGVSYEYTNDKLRKISQQQIK